MLETISVLGLIVIMAVLIWFKLPQKLVMKVGSFISKIGK